MTKRYRLIREYPGSPKLGTIIELKRNGGYELENSNSYFMTKDKVENYPEYWEEIIEKDYEILSIQCTVSNFGNYILIKGENGKFKNEYKEIKFNPAYYKIHSIKRLEDNEIFTIDDMTTLGKLSKIEIVGLKQATPSGVKLSFGNYSLKPSLFYDREEFQWDNVADLCYKKNDDSSKDFLVQKLKQPLFTTEDGVDIYENDIYYRVNANLQERIERQHAVNNISKSCFYKYFSSEQTAEEYVLMNKPCLSLNDIAKIYKTADISMSEYNSKKSKNQNHDQGVKLIDLIKEKLNIK